MDGTDESTGQRKEKGPSLASIWRGSQLGRHWILDGHDGPFLTRYRDLKGKGATDMWQAGVPIELIQALLGHASKTTTEIYIKQRWTEAQPNLVHVG